MEAEILKSYGGKLQKGEIIFYWGSRPPKTPCKYFHLTTKVRLFRVKWLQNEVGKGCTIPFLAKILLLKLISFYIQHV